MMAISISMLVALYLLLTRTRVGLIVQASLTHPDMVEAWDIMFPEFLCLSFAGGAALAGLAGVLGGNLFITEPGMAFAVGTIIFVVVVFGGNDLCRELVASFANWNHSNFFSCS